MKHEFHEPVMVSEALDYLLADKAGTILDCTVGGGGHARAVLEWRGPGGEAVDLLIGIDRDQEALAAAGRMLAEFGDRKRLVRDGFENMEEVMEKEGIDKVDGVLMDLGVSRRQLTAPHRGFSLMEDGPLDMRMDQAEGEPVRDLLVRLDRDSLRKIIKEYGEERYAGRIASAIKKRVQEGKPPETTAELKQAVFRALPPSSKKQRIHPATRTFMALRMAVNNETERLSRALEAIPRVLGPGGRMVVISYHSIEDRLIKQFMAREQKGCTCPPGLPECVCGGKPRLQVLTKKPLTSSRKEIEMNPAARSAKLRAARRTGQEEIIT